MSFSHPARLAVLQGKLESEGIEYRLQDELTAQITYFAFAMGGVKLQVRESDTERVIAILLEGGFIGEEDLHVEEKETKLDRLTANIPLLKRCQPKIRFVIFLSLIISVAAIALFVATRPSTYERLTAHRWCLDHAEYKGETYLPKTIQMFRMQMGQSCEESIDFYKYGRVFLPGFNSRSGYGYWSLNGKVLHITQADTLGELYNGTYAIKFSGESLILTSEHTTLYCYPLRFSYGVPIRITQ